MFNIIEFYTGATNLTICLPVTLAKAWHLSRTRKFEVQKQHKIIRNNLMKNSKTMKMNLLLNFLWMKILPLFMLLPNKCSSLKKRNLFKHLSMTMNA